MLKVSSPGASFPSYLKKAPEDTKKVAAEPVETSSSLEYDFSRLAELESSGDFITDSSSSSESRSVEFRFSSYSDYSFSSSESRSVEFRFTSCSDDSFSDYSIDSGSRSGYDLPRLLNTPSKRPDSATEPVVKPVIVQVTPPGSPIPLTPPKQNRSGFLAKNPAGKGGVQKKARTQKGKEIQARKRQNEVKLSGYVCGKNATPVTKAFLKEKMGSPLIPKYNQKGSPYKAYTPKGSKLKRSMKTGLVNTYARAAKSPHHCKYTKKIVASKKITSPLRPIFAPLTRFGGFIILDIERLDEFMRIREGWYPTQGSVMGMSAKKAATAAGIKAEGDFHWLHLFAFSMGGADGVQPNEAQNLILGTAAANGHHLRVEDTIRNLVSTHRQIYVRYAIDPGQKVFDAKWHVCGHFTYEFGLVEPEFLDEYRAGAVSEEKVMGKLLDSITIETLMTNYSHTSDQPLIQAAAFARLQSQQAAKKLNFVK